MKLSEKKKIALALSGGGVKAAAFHLGVCLALKEKGFSFAGGTPEEVQANSPDNKLTFKIYVGSSAGSVITTFLACGLSLESIVEAFQTGRGGELQKLIRRSLGDRQDTGRKIRPLTYTDIFAINGGNVFKFLPKILKHRSIFTGGIEALIKSGFKLDGFFTTRGIERYMQKYVVRDNRFSSLGVELFIIATQLNHSRKVVFGNFSETTKIKNIKYANFASISEAVAASASIPPVYAPYSIRNQNGKELQFFDGEIRDTLSTHVAADAGADLVIASYSIQPYHFNPAIGSLSQFGIPMIVNQALYQVIQQKIEKHIEHQQQIEAVMDVIDGYFKQSELPTEHKNKLLDIIAKRVNYHPGVDYIYIHPSPTDHEMFFADHFSLGPQTLTRVVNSGFKAALRVLRKIDM